MKVILTQDVKGSGKKGELIEVSDGYARNYLLARKLAIEASAQNMNVLKAKEAAAAHRAQVEREQAEAAAKTLAGKSVKIMAKAGNGGKLFGSVTSKEVSDELKKQLGVDVDKKKIVLGADIKSFGTYTADVKLYTGISAQIFVTVAEM